MLKATGLWAKTSAKGNRYLGGRLGGVKVLILANQDRSGENDPTHFLFFVDGEKQKAEARSERSTPTRRRSTPTYPRRPPAVGADEPGTAMPNDRVDDLYLEADR
jgi:hypothetical protein